MGRFIARRLVQAIPTLFGVLLITFLLSRLSPSDPVQLMQSQEDLETARGLFAERGIPHHPPIDWGDHDCVYFLDPDGNLLEIVAYKRPSV